MTSVSASTLLKAGVDIIESCTGLNRLKSYTLICYAGLSYTLQHLPQCPTLVLFGGMSTGKTTALDILSEIAVNSPSGYEPLRIIEHPTSPVLRDCMDSNPIVIVQEADTVDEALIKSRYERFVHRTNRMTGMKTTAPVNQGLFGALALHKREPFKDPATESRCIVLNTVKKEYTQIKRYQKGTLGILPPILNPLASVFPASQVHNLPAGRPAYNWGLLDLIAQILPFQEPNWIQYKDQRIKEDTETTSQGQDEEPTSLVWSQITEISVVYPVDKPPFYSLHRGRIPIQELRDKLEAKGHEFSSWQLGQLIRNIGFETKKQGGTMYVYPKSLDNIIKIGKVIRVEDELMNWYKP